MSTRLVSQPSPKHFYDVRRFFCVMIYLNRSWHSHTLCMVLIKNAIVVDGTGAPGEKKDVLIKDDRIVGLGSFPVTEAQTVIDAEGLTVTPGFIDINTDSDHYLSLFTDPAQQDFLLQGVTTIMGGHCGSSLAPLIKGSLESIRKWGDINVVNVDWQTVAEFLQTLEKRSLGVNFGTLVGHATVRRALIGEQARDLTMGELDMMAAVMERGLTEGAFGISTGLAYNHARNTPYAEIKMLASLVKKYGGVYTTHVRHEHEHLADAVKEAVSIATETGARTIISHFRALRGFEKQFAEALSLIEGSTADIGFDCYPFDYSIVPLYTLLPEWAQRGALEQMQSCILDANNEEQLRHDLAALAPETVIIARAPGFDYLVGKTVAAYAAAQEIDPAFGLLHLMRLTKLRSVVFKKNINFEATVQALMTDRAFVASNSPSLLEGRSVIENERAIKTFSTFLDLATRVHGKTFEWAIHAITGKPAIAYNLIDRGIIREGAVADLALLRGNQAVHVIVSGKLVVHSGAFQALLAGRVLRRSRL